MTNVFVMTWNTHNFLEIPKVKTDASIIIISLQECFNFKKYDDLYPQYKFRIKVSLIGLQSIILSKTKLKVKTKKIGIGIFGFPNKGFIACTINDKILYINAHCIPHEHNQSIRMKQIDKILRSSYENIHETIIFSGDFNFRITNKINEEGGLIKNIKNIKSFNKRNYINIDNMVDQADDFLKMFDVFSEAQITFLPTYKYKKDKLDPRRTPSYCDRIFVASKRMITFEFYGAIQSITSSDHKPVYCKFSLGKIINKNELLKLKTIKTFNAEKLSHFYQFFFKHRELLIFIIISLLLSYIVVINTI